MTSIRQLRYFVEIAECGSFSGAAERLYIAQSALSRQITALEQQLGTPLFERTARLPRLTLAGQAFLERARPRGKMILCKKSATNNASFQFLHFSPL